MSSVLLVEDDTMIASGMIYALETEGYEVRHVATAGDAGRFIEKWKPDLAILDMQLPDGSGFEVGRQLLNMHTAVIFLTVVDDENTIVKAFDEGAADYMVKPFCIREQCRMPKEYKFYLKCLLVPLLCGARFFR